MNTPESVIAAIHVLNALDVPYLIVGSLSSNIYGIPRSTVDADIVIQNDDQIEAIRQQLADYFKPEPQLAFETIDMTTKHLFHERNSSFKLEMFVLSEDVFAQTRFSRRVEMESEGVVLVVPTPEDVVVQKLRWGRHKDMADVIDVIGAQHQTLDWPYIRQWCERHGSTARLDAAIAEAGVV